MCNGSGHIASSLHYLDVRTTLLLQGSFSQHLSWVFLTTQVSGGISGEILMTSKLSGVPEACAGLAVNEGSFVLKRAMPSITGSSQPTKSQHLAERLVSSLCRTLSALTFRASVHKFRFSAKGRERAIQQVKLPRYHRDKAEVINAVGMTCRWTAWVVFTGTLVHSSGWRILSGQCTLARLCSDSPVQS